MLNWEEVVDRTPTQQNRNKVIAHPHQDWGEAPDVPYFVGRTKELDQLKQWMIEERCRCTSIACRLDEDKLVIGTDDHKVILLDIHRGEYLKTFMPKAAALRYRSPPNQKR